MFARLFARKLIRALLVLWLLITAIFFILRATGSPARLVLGPEAPPDAIAAFERVWGLDRPLVEQYFVYLRNISQGNFGQSYRDGRDAVEIVLERLPKSLELNLLGFFLMYFIAIPAGIFAALRHNSLFDRLTIGFSVLGSAMPTFLLGILLILIFAMTLKWLPSSGSGTPQHLILPVLTLALSEAGAFSRYIRSSMLDVLGQQYLTTAAAKGLRRTRIIARHALPNIAIPIVTLSGLRLVAYVSGSVVTETVFAWPGLGRLTVTAVGNRDIAVVQVIVLLIGTAMIVVNLLVDLAYGWLDPRIRYREGT